MEYSLQRSNSMQASKTEEQGMKQHQRVKTMTDMIRRIKAKGGVDANNSWWDSELLAADCRKAVLHPEWEDTVAGNEEDEEKSKEEEPPKAGQQCDRQCRSRSRFAAQDHQANSLERRSASSGGGGRERCQALKQM